MEPSESRSIGMPRHRVGWMGVGARYGMCFCSAVNRTSWSSNRNLESAPAATATYKEEESPAMRTWSMCGPDGHGSLNGGYKGTIVCSSGEYLLIHWLKLKKTVDRAISRSYL